MKRRYYIPIAMGVAVLMFSLYFAISKADTVTWYETLLTFVVSAFIAEWLCKGDDTDG